MTDVVTDVVTDVDAGVLQALKARRGAVRDEAVAKMEARPPVDPDESFETFLKRGYTDESLKGAASRNLLFRLLGQSIDVLLARFKGNEAGQELLAEQLIALQKRVADLEEAATKP